MKKLQFLGLTLLVAAALTAVALAAVPIIGPTVPDCPPQGCTCPKGQKCVP